MAEKIDVLSTVVSLIEHKKIILENIDRLKKNQGYIDDRNNQHKGLPRNQCTKFELYYGAHVHVYSSYDAELNVLLAQSALTYYNDKLQSVQFLLDLATTALERELSAKLRTNVNVEKEEYKPFQCDICGLDVCNCPPK